MRGAGVDGALSALVADSSSRKPIAISAPAMILEFRILPSTVSYSQGVVRPANISS